MELHSGASSLESPARLPTCALDGASEGDSNGNQASQKSSNKVLRNTESSDLKNNNNNCGSSENKISNKNYASDKNKNNNSSKNNNSTHNNSSGTREKQPLMNKNYGKTFQNVLGIGEYSERVENENKSLARPADKGICAENRGTFPTAADCPGVSTVAGRGNHDKIKTRVKFSSNDREVSGKTPIDQAIARQPFTERAVDEKTSSGCAVTGKTSIDGGVGGKTAIFGEKTLHDAKDVEVEAGPCQETSIGDEDGVGNVIKNEISQIGKCSSEMRTYNGVNAGNLPMEEGKKIGSIKKVPQNSLNKQPVKSDKTAQIPSMGMKKKIHGKPAKDLDRSSELQGTTRMPFSMSATTSLTSTMPQNMGAISKTYPYYDTQNKFFGYKNPVTSYKDLLATGNRTRNKILSDYASELGSKNYALQKNYLTNYIDFPALDYPTALLPTSGMFGDDPYVESAFKNMDIGPISSQENDLFLREKRQSKVRGQSAPNMVCTSESAPNESSSVNSVPNTSSTIKFTPNTICTIKSTPNTISTMKSDLAPNSTKNTGVHAGKLISGLNTSQLRDPGKVFTTMQKTNTEHDAHLHSLRNYTASSPVNISSTKSLDIPVSLSMPYSAAVSPMSLQKNPQVSLFEARDCITHGLEHPCAPRHEVYGVLNPLFDDRLWPRNSNPSLNFAQNKSAGITPDKTSAMDGTCRNVLSPGYFYGGTDRSYWEREKNSNAMFAEYFKTGASNSENIYAGDVSGGAQFGDANSKPLESESIFCPNPSVFSTTSDAKTTKKYGNIIGMSPNTYCEYLGSMAAKHQHTDNGVKNILFPDVHENKKVNQKESSSLQTNESLGNMKGKTKTTEQNIPNTRTQSAPHQSRPIKIANAISTTGNKHSIVFGPSFPNKCPGNNHKKSHKSISICDSAHGPENTSEIGGGTKPCLDLDRRGSEKRRKQHKVERATIPGLISPGSGEVTLPYTPQDLEEELMYPDTYAKGSQIIQNWNAREQDFFLGKPNRRPKFNQCQVVGQRDGRVINEERRGQEVSCGGTTCQMPHYLQSDAGAGKMARHERDKHTAAERAPENDVFLTITNVQHGEEIQSDSDEAITEGSELKKLVGSELECSRHFEKRLSLPSDSPVNIDNFDRDEYVTFKQRLLDADQDLPRCLRLKPFEPRDESLLGLPLGAAKEQSSLDRGSSGAKLSGGDQNEGRGRRRLIQRRSSDSQLVQTGTSAKNDCPPNPIASKTTNERKKKLRKQRSILYEGDETEKGNGSEDNSQSTLPETSLKEEFHRGSPGDKNFANKDQVLSNSQSCPVKLGSTSNAPATPKKSGKGNLEAMQIDLAAKEASPNVCQNSFSAESINFEEGFTGIEFGEVNNDSEMEDCDTTISVTNDGYKMRSARYLGKNRKERRESQGKYVPIGGPLAEPARCNDGKTTDLADRNKENQNEILAEYSEAEDGAASHGHDLFCNFTRTEEAENCVGSDQSGSTKEVLATALAGDNSRSNENVLFPSSISVPSTLEQKYRDEEPSIKYKKENQFPVQKNASSRPVDFSPEGDATRSVEIQAHSPSLQCAAITAQDTDAPRHNYFVCDEAEPSNVSSTDIIKSCAKEDASKHPEPQASNYPTEYDVIRVSTSTNTGGSCQDWSDNSSESKQTLSLIDRRSKAAQVKDKLKIKIESSSSMSSLNEDWSETDVVENLDDFEVQRDTRALIKSQRDDRTETETAHSNDQISGERKADCGRAARNAHGKQTTGDNNKAEEVQGDLKTSDVTKKSKSVTENKADTPYPDSLVEFQGEVSTTESFASLKNSDTLKLQVKSMDKTLGKTKSNTEKFTRNLERGSPGLIILENPASTENFSPVQRRAFSQKVIKGMKEGNLVRSGTERRPYLEPDTEMRREKSVHTRKKVEKRRSWSDKYETSDSSDEGSSQTSSSNESREAPEPKYADVNSPPGNECHLRLSEKMAGKKGSGIRSSDQTNKESRSASITALEEDNKDLRNLEPGCFLPVPEGRVFSRESSKERAKNAFDSFAVIKSETSSMTTSDSKLAKTSSSFADPAVIQSIIPEIEDTESREKKEQGTKWLRISKVNSEMSVRNKSPNPKLQDQGLPRFTIDSRYCSGDPNLQTLSPGGNCHLEQESRSSSCCPFEKEAGASRASSSRSPVPTLAVPRQAGARSPSLQDGFSRREEKDALSAHELGAEPSRKRLSPRPWDTDHGTGRHGLGPKISAIPDSRSRSKSPMVLPDNTHHHRRLSEGNTLKEMSKSPVIFTEPNMGRRFSSFNHEIPRDVRSSPRPSGSLTPRSATPRAATPRSATPRSATPRSATPRSATPRSATPRSATPRSATPRSATPRSATPRSATPRSETRRPHSHHQEAAPAKEHESQGRRPEEGWDERVRRSPHPSGARKKTHQQPRRPDDETAPRLQRHRLSSSSSSSESSSDSDWSDSSSSDDDSSSDSSSALEDLVHLSLI